MHRANSTGLLYSLAFGSALGLALAAGPKDRSSADPEFADHDLHPSRAEIPSTTLDRELPAAIDPFAWSPWAWSDFEGAIQTKPSTEPAWDREDLAELVREATRAGSHLTDALGRAVHSARLARRRLRAPLGVAVSAGQRIARPTARWLDEKTELIRALAGWYLVGASMAMDPEAGCQATALADAFAQELENDRLDGSRTADCDPESSPQLAEAEADQAEPGRVASAGPRQAHTRQTPARSAPTERSTRTRPESTPHAVDRAAHPRGSGDWIPAPMPLQ